jgi:phosphate transport system ATP-binding protein
MEKIILSVKNLYFSYEHDELFKNLNIDFKQNKIYGIFGDSGTGKTTFLKILSLLIREYENYKISGEIIFNNQNTLNIKKDLWKIRRDIVYIPQKPIAFKTTIHKNITFPLEINSKKIDSNIVSNVLKQVNLYNEVKNKLHKPATELSGGQLQRLSIARALVLNPKIILFDEPTSSLDIKNAEIIESLIKSLKGKYTIILVSHDINQIKSISDCILKLENKIFHIIS